MLTVEDSNTVRAARDALMGVLKNFMPAGERATLANSLRGEERVSIAKTILATLEVIKTMPKSYEQDGKGDDAVVYLHYFRGSVDAWITEKDDSITEELPGDQPCENYEQIQAFGKVNLYGTGIVDAEFGYVSIQELIDNGVELDLYWTPKTIKELT